jgi:hypothetical protein
MYKTILGLGVLGFAMWAGYVWVMQFAQTLSGYMARIP